MDDLRDILLHQPIYSNTTSQSNHSVQFIHLQGLPEKSSVVSYQNLTNRHHFSSFHLSRVWDLRQRRDPYEGFRKILQDSIRCTLNQRHLTVSQLTIN